MRSADFTRRKQPRFDAITHALKLADDLVEASVEMADDVFAEHPFRRDFADDAGDMRPEVARVFDAAPPSGR